MLRHTTICRVCKFLIGIVLVSACNSVCTLLVCMWVFFFLDSNGIYSSLIRSQLAMWRNMKFGIISALVQRIERGSEARVGFLLADISPRQEPALYAARRFSLLRARIIPKCRERVDTYSLHSNSQTPIASNSLPASPLGLCNILSLLNSVFDVSGAFSFAGLHIFGDPHRGLLLRQRHLRRGLRARCG